MILNFPSNQLPEVNESLCSSADRFSGKIGVQEIYGTRIRRFASLVFWNGMFRATRSLEAASVP